MPKLKKHIKIILNNFAYILLEFKCKRDAKNAKHTKTKVNYYTHTYNRNRFAEFPRKLSGTAFKRLLFRRLFYAK